MTYVVGIDPGPTPGIVGLRLSDVRPVGLLNVDIAQCDARSLLRVLDGLYGPDGDDWVWGLAIEGFVVGPRAARSRTPAAGALTRDLIERCRNWAAEREINFIERRATDVKPWATDVRLDAAGLAYPTVGMRHARDAARHAIYAAVKDCGLPDPLSARGGAR